MDDAARILVTGASGLIGTKLVALLQASGYEVVLVDRFEGDRCDPRFSVAVDLLDLNATRSKLSFFLPVAGVVHLAALAHNEAPPAGYDTFSLNADITCNLLNVVEPCNPHFIFASSVAVYGEAGRGMTMSPAGAPRPATEYGRSKLECERILSRSQLTDIEIARLTPVYSRENLVDVSKRVFLPGHAGLRMWMVPEPEYSFCHLDHAARQIMTLLERGRRGRWVRNVSDSRLYGQHEIAGWFKGPRIPIPTWAGTALAAILGVLPGSFAYRIQCDLQKLFYTHFYDTKAVPF